MTHLWVTCEVDPPLDTLGDPPQRGYSERVVKFPVLICGKDQAPAFEVKYGFRCRFIGSVHHGENAYLIEVPFSLT